MYTKSEFMSSPIILITKQNQSNKCLFHSFLVRVSTCFHLKNTIHNCPQELKASRFKWLQTYLLQAIFPVNNVTNRTLTYFIEHRLLLFKNKSTFQFHNHIQQRKNNILHIYLFTCQLKEQVIYYLLICLDPSPHPAIGSCHLNPLYYSVIHLTVSNLPSIWVHGWQQMNAC